MLRLLTEEMSVGVRKNKNTMVAVNCPEFSACVSRQPCVSQRMHVPGAHSLAHLEPCSHIDVPARRQTLCNEGRGFVRSQRRNRFHRSRHRHSTLDLGTRRWSTLYSQLDQPCHPSFVV